MGKVHCKVRGCGFCYANGRGRSAYKGHRRYVAPTLAKGPLMTRFLQRKSAQPDQAAKPEEPPDSSFLEAYPALWEYLTVGKWEDGTPRQRSTITFFYEDGLWKACLNDRDGSRSLFVSCPIWNDVLRALERASTDPAAPWRGYANAKRGGGKRS